MDNHYGFKPTSGLRLFSLLVCLVLAFALRAESFVEIPKLTSRVTDLTGTLSADATQALESKLAAFEAKKGSQIAVLLINSTQPYDIAEYGIQVADLWQVGRSGPDDGLIFIIAKADKKWRFEVGDGLEGVIPDVVAKRIGAEIVAPYFKSGDFAGGINAGVDEIMRRIESEPLPAPSGKPSMRHTGDSFIFILFGGLFAGSVFSSMLGRLLGAVIAGAGSALVASLFMGFGIGAIFIGLFVFFITASRIRGGGGWSNGGGGGYYSGGGSFGGGGSTWSGGGGNFSGGGASGSW